MKHALTFRKTAIAAALVCASVSSLALTLGRARGAAVLGQPLSISIPVQIAADEDVSSVCFEADVFYGDYRIEGSKVTVTAEGQGSGGSFNVKVLALTPVDEPVISLYVRAACGAKTARKYVILSDVTPEAVSSAPTVLPLAKPAPVGVATAVPAANPQASEDLPLKPSSADKKTPNSASVDKASSNSAAVVKQPKPAPSGRPRLKLAPIDLGVERDASLRSTSELISTPTDDLQKRAEAAALWRSLNVTPEDVLRESARIQGLEKDVQDLKLASQTLQSRTQELLSRLEKSEQQRYSNPVVYGLAFLLLAVLGIAVYLWRQRRDSSYAPWWGGSETDPGASPIDIAPGAMVAPALDTTQSIETDAERGSKDNYPPAAFDGNVDIDLQFDGAPNAPVAVLPAHSASATGTTNIPGGLVAKIANGRDFSPSMSGTLRSINTKEMLDVRQQAEFFMTLGQYEDAISMLAGSIQSSDQSNPLVYLDLLKVYHTLSRKPEFDALREEFNQIFTGHVPPYATFAQGGKGLEYMPSLCSEIADLWPRQAAIDLIEKALVRGVENDSGRELDLEAFRDLLLLHAIASRQLAETDSGWVPFSAMRVNAAPAPGESSGWAAEAAQASEPLPLIPSLASDAAGGAVDLDLDLDLDLSEPKDNLIEFDASILSQPAPDKSK